MSNPAVLAQPMQTVEGGTTQINQNRQEVLCKLLRIEPATLDHLIRDTGWGKDATQKVLVQLIAAGRLKCTNRDYGRWYSLRADSTQAQRSDAGAALGVDTSNPARCAFCGCTDSRE